MNNRITNVDAIEFLKDYEQHSETEILEEGKEKDELIEIAKAKGINLKNNKALAGFKTIYTFADKANKNRTRLPKKALLKALPSMIGKPVDIDHQRRYVIGHYIDYRYKQKEDMVVAYGVFYKANFGEEWEEAKKLFKAKKLATSYEIWCPKNKKRKLKDGTFELLQQEIAGGALLFKEEPAFEDAKVLELAKKNSEAIEENLIFAKKYDAEDIITCNGETCWIGDDMTTSSEETPKSDNTITTQVSTKIKCENCGEEFEPKLLGDIKCPKCFAILGKSGKMIYPPQLIDFKVMCPSCHTSSWRLLQKTETGAKLRCLHCAKEYKVTWAKKKVNELVQNMNFIYMGRTTCLQCGKVNEVVGSSKLKIKTVKCKRCGLEYSYDITKESYKQISKIEEIIIADKKETSEEGGKEMKDEKKVTASEKKDEKKEHDFLKSSEEENKKVISERKAEAKKEEAKAEEKPTEAKAEPKEEKVEKPTVEEPKKEETPKTEDKAEEAKKEQPEAEKAKEEKVEKTEEPKAEEAKEAPKAEETEDEKTPEKAEETKVEEKTEEKPAEEKKEESKVEEPVEARFEYEIIDNEEFEDIEVSQKFDCSCIKCGYKITTDKHCKDLKCAKCGGQMRRADRPGPGQAKKEDEAKKLTYQERKGISDKMFAVVVKVKNKKTGKMRKIRMFPIHDEAHVRNALARLGQPKPKATLKRLGVSVESVRRKILRRARQLKMKSLLERHKAGINKLAKELIEAKKKIKLYAEKAQEILKRRAELGDYEISDEDILNDDKFSKAKVEMENASLRAKLETGTDVVGSKKKDDDYYKKMHDQIDKDAFGYKE